MADINYLQQNILINRSNKMTHYSLMFKVGLVAHEDHGKLVPIFHPQYLLVKLVDLIKTATKRIVLMHYRHCINYIYIHITFTVLLIWMFYNPLVRLVRHFRWICGSGIQWDNKLDCYISMSSHRYWWIRCIMIIPIQFFN